MLRQIRHQGYLKGLNASTAYPMQPPRTVARVSNMTLNTRGALRSCDQNMGICTFNGSGPAVPTVGAFLSVQFFQPSTTFRMVLALWRDIFNGLAAPAGLGAVAGGAGGTLATSTYFYVITALDGAGGETTVSNEVSVAVTLGQKVTLTWTAVTNAYGYNVYRGLIAGGELLLVGTGLPVLAPTVTFLDTGAATAAASYPLIASPNGAILFNRFKTVTWAQFFPVSMAPFANLPIGTSFTVSGATPAVFNRVWSILSIGPNYIITNVIHTIAGNGITGGGGNISLNVPPAVNTTQGLSLVDVSGLQFQSVAPYIIKTFPAGPYQPIPSFPAGATGGTQSGLAGGGNIASPAAGGIAGLSGPIPDLVPFAGFMILCLGNGLPPYESTGAPGGTVPLINTFTGAFPSWVASTPYIVGDIIQPSPANGHVYKCIQAGTSNTTTQPAFPTGAGQTVNDGSSSSAVIWQENGSNATPAPRGAAHAISHAGSLWLWNTAPTDSADLLDGPSVLKMSDANNPNSWNPLNVAGVGRNDGQQGMGMATFTIAETGIAPEGSLVLFKEFSTYQVIGVFGASDFAIQKAQTDLGCIAPRTIKFVPGFGIVRLTHLGFAVFDGVRDRLISEEIRPYLFGGQNDIAQLDFSWAYTAKADLTVDPPMYCAAIPVLGNGGDGRLTRLCNYDLVLKAWTIVDLPWDGISVLRELNIPGGEPLTVLGGWDDGMISRWQAGDQQGWQAWLDNTLTVHNGTPLTWSVRPPTALGGSATDRTFFRRVLVRGLWNGGQLSVGAGQPSIPSTQSTTFSAVVTVDRTTTPVGVLRLLDTPSGAKLADTSFELVIDIGRNGLDSYVTVSGVQQIGGAPVEL